MDIYLYNTPKKKKELFEPIKEGSIGIYSCGPTVYWNQHIGHMYAYSHWDSMVRFFRYLGNEVKWVMNITDVGHMTSDEDTGEDKMEKGAKREGLTVWDIADKYIKQFKTSMDLLNIQLPDNLTRATEHIQEQIELIQKILDSGYGYTTKSGVIFDTEKYDDYEKFAGLNSTMQIAGEKEEADPNKKNPNDFYLWITGKPEHIMQWESPWGKGYPGWHIECTAMSTKYLGKNFDIHTGGKEHISVHHTNEVAQAYGAFKSQTANYWLHNDWLTVKGEKMSKSFGNFYTVSDLVEKGYDPMYFRYLVLTSHYRKGLVFSWESLNSAKAAYEKMGEYIRSWMNSGRDSLSEEKLGKIDSFRNEFLEKIADDLNFAEGISVLWKIAKSNIPNSDKLDLILDLDQILGLDLSRFLQVEEIPQNIEKLLLKREEFRKNKNFDEADKIRKEIEKLGFNIEDGERGVRVKKINEK